MHLREAVLDFHAEEADGEGGPGLAAGAGGVGVVEGWGEKRGEVWSCLRDDEVVDVEEFRDAAEGCVSVGGYGGVSVCSLGWLDRGFGWDFPGLDGAICRFAL